MHRKARRKPLAAALVTAGGLTLALPAMASSVVLGSGLARNCYLQTENDVSSTRLAIETCDKALTGEAMTLATRAGTFVNRGILYMRSGEIDRAVRDYDAALRIDNELGEAFLNKGAALIVSQDFEGGMRMLDTAIALGTNDLHAAHYNRGLARERLGDIEGAYGDVIRALELRPAFAPAEVQLTRFKVIEKTG